MQPDRANPIRVIGFPAPVLVAWRANGSAIPDGLKLVPAYWLQDWNNIPAIVIGLLHDVRSLATMLALGGQHEELNLNPIERTFAYQKLMETLDINQTSIRPTWPSS
jgi:hypothetical protein